MSKMYIKREGLAERSPMVLLVYLLLYGFYKSSCSRRNAGRCSADCGGAVVDENSVRSGRASKVRNSAGKVYRTETDAAGRFVLKSLPAATTNRSSQGGFFPAFPAIILSPRRPQRTHIDLNHVQELHEQIQSPRRRIRLIPRTLRSVPVSPREAFAISRCPTPRSCREPRGLARNRARQSHNLHIAGARSSETQYLLDGFEISDLSMAR